jgi:hypothetical protein
MIDRTFVGKEYPEFSVTLDHDLIERFTGLIRDVVQMDSEPQAKPPEDDKVHVPIAWPAILTFHGTACLINVWEDLGIDPMQARMVAESFDFHKTPEPGAELMGSLCVEEVEEEIGPDGGMEEQVDLSVEFKSSSGELLATYICSYRVPVAKGTG